MMQYLKKIRFGLVRSLVNFHPSSRKSENLHLMGSFCPKHIKFSMKKYSTEELCLMTLKSDPKKS